MTKYFEFFLEQISYIYGTWKPNKVVQNETKLQDMGTEEDPTPTFRP